jgi:lysophospholipase L1-like esterase
MQGIIDAIIGSGSEVFLAKAPPLANGATNNNIQQYNLVIDELLTDNAGTWLVHAGPDFYTYFTNHPEQLGPDQIHPNGAGYAAMGTRWSSSVNGNL